MIGKVLWVVGSVFACAFVVGDSGDVVVCGFEAVEGDGLVMGSLRLGFSAWEV